MLVIKEWGQPRLAADLDRCGWREKQALVLLEFYGAVRVSIKGCRARIEPGRERPGNRPGALEEAVGSGLELGLAAKFRQRPATDLVENAARRCGAVEHGCRALEDIERLESIEVDTDSRNR